MATRSEAVSVGSSVVGLRRRLGLFRLASAAGVTSAIVFALCWVGTFIPFSSPTHAFIALFSPAEMSSVRALVEGTGWALLFGALVGAVFAAVYNLFGGLER